MKNNTFQLRVSNSKCNFLFLNFELVTRKKNIFELVTRVVTSFYVTWFWNSRIPNFDKNNKNVKNKTGFTKNYIIFKIKGIMMSILHHLVLQNLQSSKKSTLAHLWYLFLDCFFKTIQRFQKFHFVWYLAPYVWVKVGFTSFPFENCIKSWNFESRAVS